jgi:hypothetical protein
MYVYIPTVSTGCAYSPGQFRAGLFCHLHQHTGQLASLHSLITAAEKRCPEVSSIHRQLLHDRDYVSKISLLVSFPSVKDYKN